MKTVKELIEILQALPEETGVIISTDEEGNNYSPWWEVSMGSYSIREYQFNEDHECTNPDDDDELDECEYSHYTDETSVNVVCLW